MREAIINLLNSDLSSNYIANQTGVEQSTIYRLRRGERKLDNLGLSKCEKLYEYGSFFFYEINPEWLKDTKYILDLIKNKDLNSKFYEEEIEKPTQFEYTLQEVKDYLENL